VDVINPLEKGVAYTHSFKFILNNDFTNFTMDKNEPVKFINKLAMAIGDSDGTQVAIIQIHYFKNILDYHHIDIARLSCYRMEQQQFV
jgi:hypothetical protein